MKSTFIQFQNGLLDVSNQSFLPKVDYTFDMTQVDEYYQVSIFKRFFVHLFGQNDADLLRKYLKQAIQQSYNPDLPRKLCVIRCSNTHTKDMFLYTLQAALGNMVITANPDTFSYVSDPNVKHKLIGIVPSTPTKPIDAAIFQALVGTNEESKHTLWLMCVTDDKYQFSADLQDQINVVNVSSAQFVTQYNPALRQHIYVNANYFQNYEEMNTTKFKVNMLLMLLK